MIAAALTLMLQLQVQGVPAGAAPSPPQSTCDKPVNMVVEARTLDPEQMMAYARAFWNSNAYQERILPVRQNPTLAGDYTVTIYAEAPLREDMVGKGTAPFYTEDISDHGVEQTEETAQ